MIEVEIRGYQSISHATFQVDGFSALVGPSNIGKSAVIRAVRSAFTNPNGVACVRHRRDCVKRHRKKAKTCKCVAEVHVRAPGFDLLWVKGDSGNYYKFNNQVYDRPGPGLPEFLEGRGLGPLKIGSLGSVQVSEQFYPIFLLNQSGPVIAEAISDVSRLGRINSATKLAEKDRAKTASERKIRESDIKTAESQLSRFEGLNDFLRNLRGVEREFVELEEIDAKVREVAEFISRFEQISIELAALQAASKITVPEDTVNPALKSLRDAARYVRGLESLATAYRRLIKASRVPFERPETFQQVTKQVKAVAGFDRDLRQRYESVQALEVASKALPDLPSRPFEVEVGEAKLVSNWVNALSKVKSMLKSEPVSMVGSPPDTSKVVAGARFLAKLALVPEDLSSLRSREKVLSNQLSTLQSEISTLKSEIDDLGICPTCKKPFLEEGHRHEVLV